MKRSPSASEGVQRGFVSDKVPLERSFDGVLGKSATGVDTKTPGSFSDRRKPTEGVMMRFDEGVRRREREGRRVGVRGVFMVNSDAKLSSDRDCDVSGCCGWLLVGRGKR